MKENTRFYVCPICGNVIELINGNSEYIMCCDREMDLLVANTTDGAHEKHIPVYKMVEDEIVVNVGEVEHPMKKEHYIMWIALEKDNQITRITLYPEQETTVRFKYQGKATLYAYCNIHGLWKAEVKEK